MKNRLARILSIAGVAAGILPMSVSAQEYFREYGTSLSSGGIGPGVMASDYSYRDISLSGMNEPDLEEQARQDDQHNFAIGPVRFGMAIGFGVEFNDNITYSDDNRESDIILRPSFSLDMSWEMSELNTLRFSLGASYAKYLNNDQYDTGGLLIAPTSALEYRFGFGPVMVKIRDRFSYQEDPYDLAALSDTATYGRYENQIGFEAEWGVNPWFTLKGGYDHYNLWTTEDDFEDQDRSIDTIFLKPEFTISPTLKGGLMASYSIINFESEGRGDSDGYMIGPFVEWKINDVMDAYLEVGYQSLKFDGEYTPERLIDTIDERFGITDEEADSIRAGTLDTEDADNFYARFQLDHKPSEVFRHRITASKTAEIGFYSNYYDLWHVEYSANFTGIRDTEISPTLFYEYYESSGTLSEEAHRYGASLGIRHYLTNSITLGLDYRFLMRDSNLDGADYYQNLAFLSIYYKF